MDRLLPHSHKELASIYVYRRQYDEAIDEALKAVDLDPNGADGYAVLAEVLNYAGQPAEAIKNVQTAMRLDPYHSAWYPYILGQAYYLRGDYQELKKALMSSFNRNPKFVPARAYRAAVYWEMGEMACHDSEIRKVIPKPPTRKGTTFKI